MNMKGKPSPSDYGKNTVSVLVHSSLAPERTNSGNTKILDVSFLIKTFKKTSVNI